jgi:hypothetical protein
MWISLSFDPHQERVEEAAHHQKAGREAEVAVQMLGTRRWNEGQMRGRENTSRLREGKVLAVLLGRCVQERDISACAIWP